MERSDPTKVGEKQKSVPSEHESTVSPLKLLLKVETTSVLPDVCDMKKSMSEGVAFNWHICREPAHKPAPGGCRDPGGLGPGRPGYLNDQPHCLP